MSKWFADATFKLTPTAERVLEFKGLNRKPVIDDGEMRDMKNLSSDEYPCLTQRRARKEYIYNDDDIKLYESPVQMIKKLDALAVIDHKKGYGYWFYYDGQELYEFDEEQTMVGMNEKIIFFPEKIWFDAKLYKETGSTAFGRLEASVTASGTVDVVANDDGTELTFPGDPDFSGFNASNAITVVGTLTWEGDSPGSVEFTKSLPAAGILSYVNGNVMMLEPDLFMELQAAGVTDAKLKNARVYKSCPNLTHVMEYGNRLWGTCDDDNTIRCSKLGDPTDWEYFQNESIDAYAATQGTEGKWTGCAAYSTHLLFFKENYVHKVYGSYPAEFQIVTQEANGIEAGSAKSVAIIEDNVFYKSRIGIMVYSGDRPELISAKFAASVYKNVVAGSNRRKYYASLQLEDGTRELIVFDASQGVWHKEDDVNATAFVFIDESLIFSDIDGRLWIVDGEDNSDDVEWFAELGPFDEFVEDKKVVSRLKARYTLDPGAYMDVFVKTDQGDYQMVAEFSDDYDRAGVIKIIPTRCDKYWIRLEGKGRCRVESLVRQYRTASGRF